MFSRKKNIFILMVACLISQSATLGINQQPCTKSENWDNYNISFTYPKSCKDINPGKPNNWNKDSFSWNVEKDGIWFFEIIIEKEKNVSDQSLLGEFVGRFEQYNYGEYGSYRYDGDLKNHTINNNLLKGKRANGTDPATGKIMYQGKYSMSDIADSQIELQVTAIITDINEGNGVITRKDADDLFDSIKLQPVNYHENSK